MIIIDVLLVSTPFASDFDIVEPLGLQYLAATLKHKGYAVEILDAVAKGYDSKQLINEILARNFKLLGFTVPFQSIIKPTLSLINNLRAKGVKSHITLGGHPPTFNFEDILSNYPSVNSIVRGEGEYTLLELTKKICSNINWKDTPGISYRDGNQNIVTLPRPLIKDLDEIPCPTRNVLKNNSNNIPAISISSSRGCYNNCTFCSIAAFYRLSSGRIWRARKAKELIDEIEFCVKNLKIDNIFLVDDNFIGPGKIGRNRAREIAKEIIKRKLKINYNIACRSDDVDRNIFALLKQSGLHSVFIGIESGNQPTLDIYKKNITVEQNRKAIKILQDLGLDITASLIMINPYSTLDGIQQDIDFLKETNCGPQINHLKALEILPGMSLIKRLKEDNLLKSSLFHYQYSFKNKAVEKVADIIINHLRPKFNVLIGEIAELKRQINMLENQKSSSQLLDHIRLRLKKLDTDLKEAVYDMISEILDLAKTKELFSSKINNRISSWIDERQNEFCDEILEIKNLSNTTQDTVKCL